MAAYQKKIYQQTLSNARSNQSFLFRNHRTALCRKNKIYMCLSVYFFNPFLVCLIFHYRIKGRYIKVVGVNKGTIPEGSYGAGSKSMLMIDEIIVE